MLNLLTKLTLNNSWTSRNKIDKHSKIKSKGIVSKLNNTAASTAKLMKIFSESGEEMDDEGKYGHEQVGKKL